jgi:hypothetical protein
MPLLSTVKTFEVLLTFFFKNFAFAFPFFKGSPILLVHGVGISSFLLLKIAVLTRVLLFFSAEVII